MGLFQRPVNMTEFYTSLWRALFRSDDESDSEEDSSLLAKPAEITKDEVEEVSTNTDDAAKDVEVEIKPVGPAYEPWSSDVESFLPRFTEILELEKQTEGWTTKVTKPTATIAVKLVTIRQAPSPKGDLPIVRAEFDFDLDVTPQDLYTVLYDQNIRKKWDTDSILEYEEFEKPFPDSILYYMVNKVPWPFSNREFVERRLIRRTESGDLELVFFATEHEVVPT